MGVDLFPFGVGFVGVVGGYCWWVSWLAELLVDA